MAVKDVKGNKATGHPGLGEVTEAIRIEATILISGLKLDSIVGSAGTIRKLKQCRIDHQPPPSGGANLQVQLNGKQGDSSIATCVVYASVIESMATWPPGLRQHQGGWLTRRIRVALTRSLDSGFIYEIKGSFHDDDNPANLTPRKDDAYRNRRGTPMEMKRARFEG